jgi:hypothetical protein
VAGHERAAARLAAGQGPQPPVDRGQLGIQPIDLAQRDPEQLPAGWRQRHSFQPDPAGLCQQLLGGTGQPVVEQGGVDALLPSGALVDQPLAQPHGGAQVQNPGGDPGAGQPALLQQLPQQPGVGAVGLGPPLGAAQAAGLGRLGQVGEEPGRLELLDHKPPTGAALHRECALEVGQLAQPGAQACPGRRHDPTPVGLAAVAIHPVEGDLGSVHIQPAYDAHRDLLRAPPMWPCSTIIRA